jgi:hypothetical protein
MSNNEMKKMEEEFRNNHYSYTTDAERIRGIVLSVSVKIEFFISKILTDYFISENNKKTDFFRFFLSNTMTFASKIATFSELVKQDKIKVDKRYNWFYKDLLYFKNVRNKMAHCDIYEHPDLIKNYDRQEIVFMSFSNKDYGVKVIFNLEENSKEDEKKLIYSIDKFTTRAGRFVATLKSI